MVVKCELGKSIAFNGTAMLTVLSMTKRTVTLRIDGNRGGASRRQALKSRCSREPDGQNRSHAVRTLESLWAHLEEMPELGTQGIVRAG